MHEPTLIKTISKRDNWLKYGGLIKEYALLPETFQIIKDIGEYFTAHPGEDEVDWAAFLAYVFVVVHPSWTPSQRDTYTEIVNAVSKAHDDPGIINRLYELSAALDIKEVCEQVIIGGSKVTLEDAIPHIDEYHAFMEHGGSEDPLAPYDLREVFESLHRTEGLKWRLPELNQSIGPVAKGDLILVGKRPEVGGTTFLTSEMTHMVTQLPENGRAVLFNNEESKHKIIARLIQSGLNWTVMDMAADPDETIEQWTLLLGTRKIDVVHDTGLDVRTVERVLSRNDYGLIGINVLWKIRGWKKLEEYQRLSAAAQWARQVADRHAPVIGIWQADGSAEGVPWLNQSQLYGSKTGVQGEADALIMIGSSHEAGKMYERYISIVKNKIPGSDTTIPKLRHGKFTVDIDPERGRFVSRGTLP